MESVIFTPRWKYCFVSILFSCSVNSTPNSVSYSMKNSLTHHISKSDHHERESNRELKGGSSARQVQGCRSDSGSMLSAQMDHLFDTTSGFSCHFEKHTNSISPRAGVLEMRIILDAAHSVASTTYTIVAWRISLTNTWKLSAHEHSRAKLVWHTHTHTLGLSWQSSIHPRQSLDR